MSTRLVLASSSPRRAQLLEQIGLPFVLQPVCVDESPGTGERPLDYARRLALDKATAAVELVNNNDMAVLAADTIVVLDDQLLGKPENRDHAAQMLALLSARSHHVITAMTLIRNTEATNAHSISEVSFRALSSSDIAQYLATGEADDKAGAYAIQGRAAEFVRHLAGSYSGVMGLPLFETCSLLGPQLVTALRGVTEAA